LTIPYKNGHDDIIRAGYEILP